VLWDEGQEGRGASRCADTGEAVSERAEDDSANSGPSAGDVAVLPDSLVPRSLGREGVGKDERDTTEDAGADASSDADDAGRDNVVGDTALTGKP
jgi:hypothetical protein